MRDFKEWNKSEVKMKKGSKGWYKENGYIMQKVINHPNENKRGYVVEHRLIMENHIGRYLGKDEIVHHKDLNRSNNILANLEVKYNHSEHMEKHKQSRNPNNGRIAGEPIFSEIKYKLYDKDRNIESIFTLAKLINTTFRKGKFEFRGRYTGLKDLFEGDVCKTREGLSKIVWFNYAFYLEGIDWEGIILLSSRDVEVKKVGNIHESVE